MKNAVPDKTGAAFFCVLKINLHCYEIFVDL